MSTKAAKKVSYRWHLRMLMAERGMYATSDLVPLLAERGVVLSREQVYRLVAKVPERINLLTLAALCDALEVSRGRAGRAGASRCQASPAEGTARPGGRARPPSPPGQGGPRRVSPSRQQAWGDLVASRVAEACPGLGTGAVSSAIAAAAPSPKAVSVLAGALGPARAPWPWGRRRWSAGWCGSSGPGREPARTDLCPLRAGPPEVGRDRQSRAVPSLSRPPQRHRLWALWGGQGGIRPRPDGGGAVLGLCPSAGTALQPLWAGARRRPARP